MNGVENNTLNLTDSHFAACQLRLSSTKEKNTANILYLDLISWGLLHGAFWLWQKLAMSFEEFFFEQRGSFLTSQITFLRNVVISLMLLDRYSINLLQQMLFFLFCITHWNYPLVIFFNGWMNWLNSLSFLQGILVLYVSVALFRFQIQSGIAVAQSRWITSAHLRVESAESAHLLFAAHIVQIAWQLVVQHLPRKRMFASFFAALCYL